MCPQQPLSPKLKTETDILKLVLEYLSHNKNLFAFRHNTYKPQLRRSYRAGKKDTGIADIICCFRGGRYIEIEIKKPEGKQSAVQKTHQEEIELLGGNYFLIRNLDDVDEMILQLEAENKIFLDTQCDKCYQL